MKRKNLKVCGIVFSSLSALFLIGCVLTFILSKGNFFAGVYPLLFFCFLTLFGVCGATASAFFYAMLKKPQVKKCICSQCKKAYPHTFAYCPYCGAKRE